MTTTPCDLTVITAPIEARGEVERVYRMLREWIITAELAPGSFLSEMDMAERCGTSRTPVRGALNRLSQDGWVNSIHRKGFQVQPITLRDINELYTYRRLFERYAGERAAANATVAHISALRRIVDLEQRPNASMTELAALNEQFHLAIAERTENERIIGQMRLVMAYLRRMDSIVFVVDKVSHSEILEAISARDGERASSLLSEHIEYSLNEMLHLFCH
jgi:DNA-binding GntR family transcriptional regulator